MNTQRLSIVIPTHRRNDLLRRTIDSLSKADLPIELRQTLILENGGRFGADRVVAGAPASLKARYVYFEQGNKSAALNHALTLVQDDLLVFFDDDVRVGGETLRAYADVARAAAHQFYGGPVGCDYDQPPPPWVDLPRSAIGWEWDQNTANGKQPEFLGFNWAAFADHIRACGGFDPRVGPGGTTGARGQETLMQSRLRANGYVARYVSDAVVWHYVPEDRCSEKWALRRAYQNGFTFGLELRDETPRFLETPRWMIRRCCSSLGKAVMNSILMRRVGSHRNWARFHFYRGGLAGVKQARDGGNRSTQHNE